MNQPHRYDLPGEMTDAYFLVETGWPPDIIDKIDLDRAVRCIIYKKVKQVNEQGGTYKV